MKPTTRSKPYIIKPTKLSLTAFLAIVTLVIAGCGGGSSTTDTVSLESSASLADQATEKSSIAPSEPSTSGLSSVNTSSCRLVQDVNFNKYSGAWTSYSKSMLENDFGPTTGFVKCIKDGSRSNENNCTKAEITKVGDGMLRAFFGKGALLGWETGFTWINKIPQTKKAVMEYRLKFENGFDWTYGGKLPGLCGGGSCPAGCTDISNQQKSFSTRIMWQKLGGMITYPYWPDNTNRCGGTWRWHEPGNTSKNLTMKDNTWYTVRQELEVGTANATNGKLRMFLNNQLVYENNKARFVTDNNTYINAAYWTTYVGGSTDMFRPSRDQHIFFDDFKVWVDCGGKPNSSGSTTNPPSSGSTSGSTSGPTSGTSNEAQRCDVIAATRPDAEQLFKQQCSGFTQRDCDPITVDGKTLEQCSSEELDSQVTIPVQKNGVVMLQAEDYARAKDGDPENKGDTYRAGAVDIQATQNTTNSFHVGWVEPGEYLEFDFYVPANGRYDLIATTASPVDTASYSLALDGNQLTQFQTVPYTGDYHVFKEKRFSIGQLTGGGHSLRFIIESNGFNLDSLKLVRLTDTSPITGSCAVIASDLDKAMALYENSCQAPRQDCDSVNDSRGRGWICSSHNVTSSTKPIN